MAKFLVVTVGRLSTKASYAMAGRVYAIVVPIYALATRHTVLVTTSVCMVEVISVFRRPQSTYKPQLQQRVSNAAMYSKYRSTTSYFSRCSVILLLNGIKILSNRPKTAQYVYGTTQYTENVEQTENRLLNENKSTLWFHVLHKLLWQLGSVGLDQCSCSTSSPFSNWDG